MTSIMGDKPTGQCRAPCEGSDIVSGDVKRRNEAFDDGREEDSSMFWRVDEMMRSEAK